MLEKTTDFIKDQDQFSYSPEWAIGFKKNKTFNTIPGGIWSILLSIGLILIWS